MDYNQLFELKCQVQHYPWGARCRGQQKPFIADLENMPCDENEPFAELWIGAHPKLPSNVAGENGRLTPLDQFIAANPRAILGGKLIENGYGQLPFLLKVLDCEQSLSIQAHPDKQAAENLHQKDPGHYPDDNHKPEIAISINGMDAFCEFRPAADIRADLQRLSSLSNIFVAALQAEDVFREKPKEWLRQAYSKIFSMSEDEVTAQVRALVNDIKELNSQSEQDEWVLRLIKQHPADRGVLSAYFLNLLHLKKGEAVFLGPNEPHAYLEGTIVECMASSDNVVRAGLTSKFIDHQTLVDMLTYNDGCPEIMRGETGTPGDWSYKVPVPEFQVEFYTHDEGFVQEYEADGMVSLMLVLEGEVGIEAAGKKVSAGRGSAWLWPAALETCRFTFQKPGTTIVRAQPNLSRSHT